MPGQARRARYPFTKRQAIAEGVCFIHHSNPGIDVLGLNFNMVWQLD
tara:strand:+ start:114 stop:254 length:141 start_codon:yes stop_codon:yes gene_type:complete